MPKSKKNPSRVQQWLKELHLLFQQYKPDPAQTSRLIVGTVSIGIALLFWLTLNMKKTYTWEIQLPTVVEKLPTGWTLSSHFPKQVSIEVTATGWQLLQLIQQPPTIPLDFSKVRNDQVIDFAKIILPRQMPKDVKIGRILPEQATIRLARIVTKRIPVRFSGTLKMEPTYDLLDPPKFEPSHVTIIGPENVLGLLSYWPTAGQTWKDVRKNMSEIIALSDTLSDLVQVSSQSVQISVRVGQFTEATRRLAIEAVDLPPEVSNVRFEPAMVDVTYQVPIQQYADAQQARDFKAYVSYRDILADQGSGFVVVNIKTPTGLVIRKVHLSARSVNYFIPRGG